MPEKPLILVDGSSYFFRAFHALPPLLTQQGQPTGAIYGVVNMIKRLLKTYEPDQIAIIFDAPGKNFRHEWDPNYKAHRKPTPPELTAQFDPLIELLKALGLFVTAIEGVEADDVIGTLTQMAVKNNQQVLISTGDKDMAQLVGPQVTLINTMTDQSLDEQGVKEKFGVFPAQIVDYLTLVGDASDNIPGVQKCGPKTAVKWLESYQTLDVLIQHHAEIKGKIGEYLRAFLPQLEQSRRLVTLKTDVNLPFGLRDLDRKPENTSLLREHAQALEFKAWLKDLPISTPQASHIPLLSEEALLKILNPLNPPKAISIRFTFKDHQLIAFQFSLDALTSYRMQVSETYSQARMIEYLRPLLEHPDCLKISFDFKSIWFFFKQNNIMITSFHDLMLAFYVSNSTTPAQNNYLSEDASTSVWVDYHNLLEIFTPTLKMLYLSLEMPLLPILAEMECLGVLIDCAELASQGQSLSIHVADLEKKAHALAGHPFNLNSPKQLLEILYHEQHLPILSKTPKGQPSTSESVLQTLAEAYPLPAIILDYRSGSKLLSTYIEALPKHVDPKTQRIHTTFNQALTSTGRLSSSDPNLQNIPIKHPEGRAIRKAFIAPQGFTLLTADYSQIELRIMAHLSKDPNLQQAFVKNLDVHTATASELFHVSFDHVNAEQRRRAKAINFGLIYGMSSFGLSKQLQIAPKEAQHYIDYYFERYPGVLQFMIQTRELAREQGYVETLLGRKLYIPNINSRQKMHQKAAERMAINAPLQGTAADLIKKAMIDIHHWLLKTESSQTIRLILQVHDELVFEVREDQLDNAQMNIQTLMENVLTLSVPLLVSIGSGPNWDLAH